MKLSPGALKLAVETLLATATATLGVYLWFIDIASMQRVFGTLMAGELVILSMLVYAHTKPSIGGRVGKWMLLGCIVAAVLLLFAVQLGNQ